MEPWQIAALIKPFALLVLFLIVIRPLSRLFYRFIPNGKVKAFLFRERTREGIATADDKAYMGGAVAIAYIVLFVFIGLLMWSLGLQ
jgi:hypothetical protein